jgi:hypothetical protein
MTFLVWSCAWEAQADWEREYVLILYIYSNEFLNSKPGRLLEGASGEE